MGLKDGINKTCRTCGELKAVQDFNKRSCNKDGIDIHCKPCRRSITNNYRKNNEEKIKLIRKKNYEKNKEIRKANARSYYWNNRDKIRKTQAEYQKKNGSLIAKKKQEKIKSDPFLTFKERLRGAIKQAYKRKSITKKSKTLKILGASYETIKLHLDATFEENYGMPREWLSSFDYHIDHIIPISMASTEEEVIRLNHYTNLQILLKEDNLSKNNNTEWSLY